MPRWRAWTPSDFLRLLHRVGDILEVDTAAVLLCDASSNELVATAARGLEAEVRQGVWPRDAARLWVPQEV